MEIVFQNTIYREINIVPITSTQKRINFREGTYEQRKVMKESIMSNAIKLKNPGLIQDKVKSNPTNQNNDGQNY